MVNSDNGSQEQEEGQPLRTERIADIAEAARASAKANSDVLVEEHRRFVKSTTEQLERTARALAEAFMAKATLEAKTTPEEEEATRIFERIDRELPEVEARIERLMRSYGL